MNRMQERMWKFLFPPDSGRWVLILRVGLGLQIMLYALSLRSDWNDLFGTLEHGLVSRALTEAVVSSESMLVPRLGWLITIGKLLGLAETSTLFIVWLCLLATGLCLIIGLFSRFAAIAGWFLYLCSAESGTLFSYGVDNFTIIGLFYLMIAPLPNRWALSFKLVPQSTASSERLGFHRRILQVHLCIIYFFAGLSKSMGTDWWNGNSAWRALTRPPFDLVPPEVLIRFAYPCCRPLGSWFACWRPDTLCLSG